MKIIEVQEHRDAGVGHRFSDITQPTCQVYKPDRYICVNQKQSSSSH